MSATIVNGPTPEMLARIEAACAAKRRQIAARDAARKTASDMMIIRHDTDAGVVECSRIGQTFTNGIRGIK